MQEEKDLYLPIFYNTLELAAELSNEEFGIVVRRLLEKLGKRSGPDENDLPANLKITYNFMLDGALRIIGRRKAAAGIGSHQTEAAKASSEKSKKRYGNFDPKEAFEKALERSYGK